MRRSSSTSSRCGASSAGCGGVRATVAAWAHDHSFAFAVALPVAEDGLQHLVGIVAIDHRAQELADRIRAGWPDVAQRAVDPVGLQAGELRDQRLALGGGEKKALPPVVIAGLLHDIAFVEQLLEHPSQRLLGDAQHVEQVGDLQAGIAVDEMQHPVMGPAEAEGLELMVGVADEIPIGEEQQLDDIPAQIGRRRGRRPPLGRPSNRGRRSGFEKFMSAILTYLGFNVTKRPVATKY